jgi:hypothetical protein
MKAIGTLFFFWFAMLWAFCEPAPVRIEGLYLGITGKEADEIQRKAGI